MIFINIALLAIIITISVLLILSHSSKYILEEEYKRLKNIEAEWEAEKTAHKFEVGNLSRQLAKAKDDQQRWFAAYTESQRELEELRKKGNDNA